MRGVPWSKREEDALRKLMPKYWSEEISQDDLLRVFRRSWDGIIRKAACLGMRATDHDRMNLEAYAKLLEVIDG
jgi:hypothetical protein